MTPEQLADALKKDVIFARTSPEDKLHIVTALQNMGNIVAVTGDGVNDAPALRKANIGISMGLNGTDVARESSDIVLRDDNFASIVQAVALGRSVFHNIRKFSTYVFTSNVAEAVPFALMIFSSGLVPLPLTLMQVLFIDLGTDMLPAIGLGADPIEPSLMKQAPRHLSDRLLSVGTLAKAFLWYGLIEAAAGLSGYFYVNYLNGWPTMALAAEGTDVYRMATTATVASIVACQMGTVLACRTNTESIFSMPLFSNKILLSGLALEAVLLLLVVYAPAMQYVFNTAALPLPLLGLFCLWCPLVIVLDELKKLLVRKCSARAQSRLREC
jgi:magnesium-transporting ATPase (P-type)